MNTQPIRSRFPSRWLVLLGAAVSATAGADTGPTLADAAIYSTVVVPANVAFALSVEFPTAVGDAYLSNTTYSTTNEYVGYFNPNMCYDYVSNTSGSAFVHQPLFETLTGYYQPVVAASSHVCSGHWSGNFLNWVLTQTIDPLRKTMTGGARIVDEAGGITVLQRAYQDTQGGTNNQNIKSITTASVVAGATPFSDWTSIYTNNLNTGLNFVFSQSSTLGTGNTTGTDFGTVTAASALNSAVPCSTASSNSNSVSMPSNNNTISLGDNPSRVTVTANSGCSNSSSITVMGKKVTAGSGKVIFSVSGLGASGVTATFTPTYVTMSTTGNDTETSTLTLTAGSSAVSGTYNLTITGTAGTGGSAVTGTTTLRLTVSAQVPNSTFYQAQGAGQVCAGVELSGTYSDKEGNSYGGTTDNPPKPNGTVTAADGSAIVVYGRCRAYGANYKPVGLMQKYAAENATQNDTIRYSAFGYLLDSASPATNQNLDGGIMRARMAYVGPYKASPGTTPVANPSPEWDANTGVFAANPDSTDATATPTVTNGGTAATTNGVTRSGVANYLNLFGFVPTSSYSSTTRAAYKRYDSVSELYYMTTRYFRNLGNIASHTSTAAAITSGEATNDKFPVIENWDDPIQYTCSTNYIVGIGDIHTWNDENLPTGNGAATVKSSYEVAAYAPTDDAAVSARAATDYVAKLENLAGDTGGISGRSGNYTAATGLGDDLIGNIASPSGGWGASQNSFYMAGLAFDVHVRDIRPDLTKKTSPITLSTFWLDVMEGNDYHQKNQFWLTAKYGGFDTTYTYLQSDGKTYNPFPINPDPNSTTNIYVNPNNSGTAVGASAAANTYTYATPSIKYPSGSGTATTTAKLPLSAWCGTGGQSCNTDDHGNYVPDQYYQAGSPAKMAAGLSSAFAKITAVKPAGTGTALALASSSVTAIGNTNYVINYDNNYGGDIQAQQIVLTQTGGVIAQSANPTVTWDARSFLPPNNATSYKTYQTRLIATSNAQGKGNGVPFQWTNLSSAEKTALSSATANNAQQNVLNYIRGDQCNEAAAGNTLTTAVQTTTAPITPYNCKTVTGNTTSLGYRSRTTTVLGDIINAQPVIVSAPNSLYGDAPLNPGYTNFKSVMTKSDGTSARGTTLYIGGNDGMLHAFDTSTGIERFAYVPSALFTANKDKNGNPVGLSSLTVSPLQHHFMVDGQALVADIDLARTGMSTSSANWSSATALPTDWRSVLIGGLGKGGGSTITSGTCTTNCQVGGGYYAIDVTNPTTATISSSFSPSPSSSLSAISSESTLAGKVLWEIDQSNSDFAHMGYSYGLPLVVKTKNYGWTLVLTSGYGNDDGSGWIYLVNPKTGALLEKISTGVGDTGVGIGSKGPAGLAQVTAFIPDVTDYTADALYAADLLGNVWRVDLTSSSMSVKLFATLAAPDGSAQAVTTYPYTAVDPTAGTRYVFVGTGKLLADSDLVLSQTQTFYAFQDGTSTGFDTTSTFPITRSNLVVDNLSGGLGTSLAPYRGFYIDLPPAQKDPYNPATQPSAYRIDVQPVAYSGIVGFAANLEGQDICIKGSSRVFQLNFDSGYSFNGTLAGIGRSIIVDKTGSVANFIDNTNGLAGLVTNLGFGTSTSDLSGSGTPIISLLIGMDTGSKTTSSSMIGGLKSVRSIANQARLNWREVQNGQ